MITIPNQQDTNVPEKDLKHAQQLSVMEELAAGLAHETQERFTVIANYANGGVHRLENDRISAEELKSLLKEIASTAMRVNEITRRAKNFSKKQYPNLEILDLNELISGAVDFIRDDVDDEQINLKLQLCNDLPKVFADRTQISQVIVNLLRNSIEAFENFAGDRCLSLRSYCDKEFVHVKVEDSGPGITAELQMLVFDQFFTTKPNALGIGLGMCRSIIDRHHGQMSLESEEGQGARFGFSLPTSGLA